MGLFDKIKGVVGFNDEDEFYEEEQQEEYEQSVFNREEVAKKKDKVVNIHATTQLQVIVVKPERFDDVAVISDHFKAKKTIVLNLESTKKDVAGRIVDFLGGVAYAADGHIKKIANFTYILTPYNVDITGEIIDELESNMVLYE
ncbi:MAG: cell division protein SepF [Clostridiales bacterium]|nr:cell division protein SepF [Clostridiales bacterium]